MSRSSKPGTVRPLTDAQIAAVSGGQKPFDCLHPKKTDYEIYKCLKKK